MDGWAALCAGNFCEWDVFPNRFTKFPDGNNYRNGECQRSSPHFIEKLQILEKILKKDFFSFISTAISHFFRQPVCRYVLLCIILYYDITPAQSPPLGLLSLQTDGLTPHGGKHRGDQHISPPVLLH